MALVYSVTLFILTNNHQSYTAGAWTHSFPINFTDYILLQYLIQENLHDPRSQLPTDVELPNSDAASVVCSHSEFMSSSPSSYRSGVLFLLLTSHIFKKIE